MIYALAIGCFVLGLVTRDVIAASLSALRMDRSNRRAKRRGANIAPTGHKITLRPASSVMASGDIDPAASASRAERLFGQQPVK